MLQFKSAEILLINSKLQMHFKSFKTRRATTQPVMVEWEVSKGLLESVQVLAGCPVCLSPPWPLAFKLRAGFGLGGEKEEVEPGIYLLGTSIKKLNEKGQKVTLAEQELLIIFFFFVVVINDVVENAIHPLMHSFKNKSLGW